ncbi:MAG TPA: ribosome maturation factor RimM [Terriglobales bacterium]|nr:ribosome maturation factor RimM [Terriglobales bacterium]
MADPSEWVTLARLVKTQGHKGELGADLLSDIPGRFDHLRQVWLLHPSGRRQAFGVARHWYHQGRVVLAFDGIADMTAAEAWLGAEVQVPRAERAPAPADRYYWADLEGCEVLDRGRALGHIAAVEEIPGAPALLHVRTPAGGELLIPFAAAYVESLSLPERRIAMALPEGLLEL